MFTTLTIAMTLSGAVAIETPIVKTEATRPEFVQLAANFGKGNISSGNRERRFGKRFDNGGRGIFGANLATPPGGNKPFGNGKGSNGNAGFGNGKGSNGGNAGFGNAVGSNGGNAAFGNGKGSNGGNTGFGNGVGSNGGNAGFGNGKGSNGQPTGYATGAPQGYATGTAPIAPKEPNKGYATGQGNQGGQGNGQGIKEPGIQPPAGNGHNGAAPNNGQSIIEQIIQVEQKKG